MKISYITMQWPAASETFAARDILALKDLGHDIEALALRPDNRNAHDLITSFGINDIPCIRMNINNQIKGLVALVKNLPKIVFLTRLLFVTERNPKMVIKSLLLFPAVFRIFGHLKHNKPDIVHLFWGHYPSMVGLLLSKYIPEIHVTQFLGPYDLQYNYALSRPMAQKATSVFTHVESNRPALNALGIPDDKIHVIHRGIDTTGTAMAKADNPASLIFVGRLMRAKGIFEMLNVMQELVNISPKAHLTVIGDGEDREKFKTAIKEKSLNGNITLTGWLSPKEIQSHLLQSSIMIFLSHSERLPNAAKEAMACGVVPVSSRTAGIEELITEAEDGYIVDNIHETKSIAEQIAQLISDPEKHLSMAGKARQKILDHFDVKAAMQRYLSVWSKR